MDHDSPHFSHARRWATVNRYWTKDVKQSTHLLLNQGKWKVPVDVLDEMYKCIERDVREGKYNWLCEKRHENSAFPLIVDCDADDDQMRIVETDEWLVLIREILASLEKIYGHTHSAYERRVIILYAEHKKRKKDGVDVVKSGRHLVFPDIRVTSDIALRLRKWMMDHIEATKCLEQCPILCGISYDDLFDECIYTRNGFRMAYSRKARGCVPCQQRRKRKQLEDFKVWKNNGRVGTHKEQYYQFDDCEECKGHGYIDEGRPYLPDLVIDGDGNVLDDELKRLKESVVYTLQQTSMYTKRADPDPVSNALPDEMPSAPHLVRKGATTRGTGGYGGRSSNGWSTVPARSDTFQEVDEFIRKNNLFDGEDDELLRAITSLKKNQSGDVYIAQTHSQFCRNKGSKHNVSTIYFQIKRSGIQQRCYSAKAPREGCPPCTEYRSEPFPLTNELRRTLFPLDDVFDFYIPVGTAIDDRDILSMSCDMFEPGSVAGTALDNQQGENGSGDNTDSTDSSDGDDSSGDNSGDTSAAAHDLPPRRAPRALYKSRKRRPKRTVVQEAKRRRQVTSEEYVLRSLQIVYQQKFESLAHEYKDMWLENATPDVQRVIHDKLGL